MLAWALTEEVYDAFLCSSAFPALLEVLSTPSTAPSTSDSALPSLAGMEEIHEDTLSNVTTFPRPVFCPSTSASPSPPRQDGLEALCGVFPSPSLSTDVTQDEILSRVAPPLFACMLAVRGAFCPLAPCPAAACAASLKLLTTFDCKSSDMTLP